MTVVLYPADGESLADLIKVTADLTDTEIRNVKTTFGGVVVDDATALAYLSGRSDLSNVDNDDTDDEDKARSSRRRSSGSSSTDTSGSGDGGNRSGRGRPAGRGRTSSTAKEKA